MLEEEWKYQNIQTEEGWEGGDILMRGTQYGNTIKQYKLISLTSQHVNNNMKRGETGDQRKCPELYRHEPQTLYSSLSFSPNCDPSTFYQCDTECKSMQTV